MPVTRVLYPLYQLGNPQLRIFRPKWFLTLVRPGKELPSDTVQFRIPLEMTKYDVKNYLEKIYEVPVGAVRTRIQFARGPRPNIPRWLLDSAGSTAQMLADGENVSTPILCHLGTQACELPLAPYHVCVLDSAFLDGSETPRIGFQAQGQTFTFPDIFPTKERAVAEGSMEELQEKFMEDEKQRQKPDPRRGGVTEWFGL
ncbi:hypothetical protein fugu_011787 [Takifugu bimaculatus]|uniref:Large ribosomal subunit protein uL23m n=1 Tax=Takifugu bimaculatus TaxID=433685 RepID=A0A4Z2C8U6_9TELE|nr:hypothetical protein fugu_011787 [Takifugu bimaculatus]